MAEADQHTYIKQALDKEYTARPHTIRAFYWSGENLKPPTWFREAYHEGKIQVTINSKEKYIAIYDNQGVKKAFPESWICMDKEGNIFTMSNQRFKESFQ